MQRIFKYIGGDKAIWMVVLFMALASILLVYSSIVTLAYKYQGGNTFYYILKHSVFIVSGFGFIYLIHKVDYKYFSRIAQLLFWISIPLLLLTLLMGANLNNASRWLVIPIINQSFQTSDLAKLALIMFTARSLAVRKDRLKDFNKGFLPLLVPVGVICVLILPANFSTAAVLATSCLMLMFMAGVRFSHISVLIPTALTALGLVYLIGKAKPELFPRLDTWVNRIERFVGDEPDRDGNFQVEQAKIAIASGGALGKGPGNSTQRNFLPHPYSDFIYAIVLEEYGMLGGFVVLLFYLVLLYRSIKIVQRVDSDFGAYLVLGLSFSLVFQGLINMAVNVNLLPVTGQPLPLVSMGGTSLWFTCISLGIILSVSRSVEQAANKAEERKGGNYAVS
jgi:cell division protein FtsW